MLHFKLNVVASVERRICIPTVFNYTVKVELVLYKEAIVPEQERTVTPHGGEFNCGQAG